MKDRQSEITVITKIETDYNHTSNEMWLDLIVDYLYQCYFDKHLFEEAEIE